MQHRLPMRVVKNRASSGTSRPLPDNCPPPDSDISVASWFLRLLISPLVTLMLLLVPVPALADRSTEGEWGPIIAWPHIPIAAANLPDGRILTWSGSERRSWPTTEQTYTATWDPVSGVFIEVFHPTHNMFCSALVMTPEGQVFANGGRNKTNSPWTSLFNYQDNQWTQIESMPLDGGRWYPTTVLLPDGAIFTALGTATNQKNPDLWDPVTGWQTQNGIDFNAMVMNPFTNHTERRLWPLLHVAPNGKLFHSGPTPQMHWIDTEGNGSFEATGSQFTDWYHKHGTTVMYDEGKLLTAGGWTNGTNKLSSNKAFTVDISGPAPIVQLTQSMTHKRKYHNGVILPTGEVLVIGGNTTGKQFNDGGSIFDPEIWNPVTGTWRLMEPMDVARNYHSVALLLTDGRVLSAGSGYNSGDPGASYNHQDGQLFSPPYLFTASNGIASRPVINTGPTEVSVGQIFNVTTDTNIAYFSLIKMSATTHAINTDLRFFKPQFTNSGGNSYQVTMHTNPNVATPGYWMLFAVDGNGVPSEAHVLHIAIDDGSSTDNSNPFYEYFEGNWSVLPDFNALTPVTSGTNGKFDLSPAVQSDNYAFRFSGRITLSQSGDYTFYTASDEGSRLFINGSLVVDNDGLHTVVEQQGTVNLAAGDQDIRVTFFESTGPDSLLVSYSGPGIAKQEIPASVLGSPLPLQIDPIVTSPTQTGTVAAFTATASGQQPLQYNWNFGDGTPESGFSNDPAITHAFSSPGRHVVSVTLRDATGNELLETFIQLIHAPLTATQPVASTSVLESAAVNQAWNVNPDNDTVTVIDTLSASVVNEVAVGDEPRSLAIAPDGRLWVVNEGSATISIINTGTLAVVQTLTLDTGSQPYGLVFGSGNAYIALQATGEVVKLNGTTGAELTRTSVGYHPRHLSLDATAQTLYVSRFITPPLPGEATATPVVDDGNQLYGGEVLQLDTGTLNTLSTIVLQHSDRTVSEHSGPGLPNYLGPAVISPDGSAAWVPSKQDNILAGTLRGGQGMTFDQTVRAVTSKIDLPAGLENFDARVDHDNAGVAGQAAFDIYGLHVFVALEGNREVAVIDAYTAVEILRFNVGRAPQGLAVSADGLTLYVHNFMDRSVGIYDISGLVNGSDIRAVEIATLSTVGNEALTATVLNGKQLFYDAQDDRLALLDYMSCASCHNDGEQDGRVWDFTGLGEGLRNTLSLKSGTTTHGFLHWSANFDEVQDFEAQIRNFAGGIGLMDTTDFLAGTRAQPLGDPKAGLSPDLDALAAYVNSLTTVAPSPYRAAGNVLSAAAETGRQVFYDKGCSSCHVPLPLSDSSDGSGLHDIGTLKPGSGKRLNGLLSGIDTPTLLGVWYTSPYLHDGSALTLIAAMQAHQGITLSPAELSQLEALLLEMNNGNEALPPGSSIETVDVRVSTGKDDAEEKPSGSVSTASSDLELIKDGSQNQLVGMRFTGVAIPANAIVISAWIQFQADETASGATQVSIRAQAADNPAGFTSSNGNLSSRARTINSVNWTIAPWPTTNAAGPAQRTPNMASIVQEVVNRSGWQSGQSMVVLIDGSGKRTAESYNGKASAAPLLHVDYIFYSGPPVDTDGDGVLDNDDAFPNDPSEWVDTDGDGVGDNSDEYPNDPTESVDSDGDGVGDNGDAFPNDPAESADTDGDGVGDNSDVFPNDPGESVDTDGDGVGDNGDAFPNDPTESADTDGDGVGDNADAFPNDPTRWEPNPAGTQTIDIRVNASKDDAEEKPSGSVSTASSDLELIRDGSQDQIVGMRFTGVALPAGAVVISAWVQFQVDETSSGTAQLTVQAQAADNPAGFTSSNGNLSSRPRTNNSASWNVAPWPTTNAVGSAQHTTNLAGVIQEIANRPGWQSGQAIVILIEGSGRRTAESYNGSTSGAPLLHIEYIAGEPPVDSDGDGVPDIIDAFPNDPSEWADSDGDGVGDNSDDLPNDPTETVDTDGDGVGDNSDVFPNDPAESADTDGDGVGDNADAFPNDPAETVDTDGDGTGDNSDEFPNDPNEWVDTDGDGVGDNADAFPNDPTRWDPEPGSTQTIEIRVAASKDDAEEKPSGSVSSGSSDLELTTDGSQSQQIGMRFTGVTIPAGATVTNAWVQFQVDETSSASTQLTIRAQAADNPVRFSSNNNNISNRPRTANSVDWNVNPWPTRDAADADQRTPDLTTVVQEVINRPGWQTGQAMVILIDGSGRRTAESYNGNSSAAPLLHIEYSE